MVVFHSYVKLPEGNNHAFLTADRHVFPWSGLVTLVRSFAHAAKGWEATYPFAGLDTGALFRKRAEHNSVHHHHGWITLMITYPKDSKGLFESIWFFLGVHQGNFGWVDPTSAGSFGPQTTAPPMCLGLAAWVQTFGAVVTAPKILCRLDAKIRSSWK